MRNSCDAAGAPLEAMMNSNSRSNSLKPDEGTYRNWLSLVLGDDEMEQVGQLPKELLTALYGDVCAFGPAGHEMKEFLIRIEHYPNDYAVHSQLLALQNAFEDPALLTSSWKGFQTWITDSENEELDLLLRNLVAEKNARHSKAFGMYVILWLITGQYAFPPGFLPAGSVYVSYANLALRRMKLPRLKFRE